jgi:hypothetical protein
MATTMCKSCKLFLEDFLPFAIPKESPLTPMIRQTSLKRITPELSTILLRISHRLPKKDYDEAVKTSNRIARRERPLYEYQALLLSATLNFLKFSHPWISSELSMLPCLLMEAGVLRPKDRKSLQKYVWDYLNYLVPVMLQCVYEIHDDHIHPKGLMTQANTFLMPKGKEETKSETLADKEDYMSEVLAEDDDLYF